MSKRIKIFGGILAAELVILLVIGIVSSTGKTVRWSADSYNSGVPVATDTSAGEEAAQEINDVIEDYVAAKNAQFSNAEGTDLLPSVRARIVCNNRELCILQMDSCLVNRTTGETSSAESAEFWFVSKGDTVEILLKTPNGLPARANTVPLGTPNA